MSREMTLQPVKLLIFQATPFCNIDCSYCYLPDRNLKRRLDIGVVKTVCQELSEAHLVSDRLTVLWHAGEPLVAPQSFYEEAHREIASIFSSVDLDFAFQTNGTLLNADWLDFFSRHRVELGLSCDGPRQLHDKHRRSRKGVGTFDVVKRAAEQIKEAGLKLNIICVLTRDSIEAPDEIFNFFESIGADFVSFNIDEREGINPKSSFDGLKFQDAFRTFLARYFILVLTNGSRQRVRELEDGLSYVFISDHSQNNLEVDPIRILTIGHDALISSFSPELHHLTTLQYGAFTFGTAATPGWLKRLQSDLKLWQVAEDIKAGCSMCKNTCSYYDICGGGSPSNKYGEHRTFVATETMACGFYKKSVADAVVDLISKGVLEAEPPHTPQKYLEK